MLTITCDMCGSQRVEEFCKEQPKVESIKMSDFVNRSTQSPVQPLIMTYTTMVLLCKDCGYRLEFSK